MTYSPKIPQHVLLLLVLMFVTVSIWGTPWSSLAAAAAVRCLVGHGTAPDPDADP